MSAEPTLPSSAPDGKSLFVNVTRAVIPAGSGAESASWIAWSSGFASGVGPPPPAATAIAAAPPASTRTEAIRMIRRGVDSVRRNLTMLPSVALPDQL